MPTARQTPPQAGQRHLPLDDEGAAGNASPEPVGFESLATEIWKFTSVGSYSQAASPPLLLLAAATPFVALLAGRHGAAATRNDLSVPPVVVTVPPGHDHSRV